MEMLLAKVLAHLPISWTSHIGAILGRSRARKAIAAKRKWVARLHDNFLALEGVSDASVREQKIIQHMEHIGRLYAEYTVLHRMAGEGRFSIEGAHYLTQDDRAKLFVCAHTAHWELVAEVLKQHKIPVADLYDPLDGGARVQLALQTRKRICPESEGFLYIPSSKSAPKEIVGWLKTGGNFLIFGDEEVDSKIYAPAFDREVPRAGNLTKAVKLASRFNMQLVPLHIKREGNARYKAIIETPIEPPSATAPIAEHRPTVIELDRQIERWVREDICHWYWLATLDLKRKIDNES